jgi:hypothetical protein
VSIIQPRTICSSLGAPSAISFGLERMSRLVIGLSFPAWARLVQCIASGTTWGCVALFDSSVSRKQLMRSSVKVSTHAVCVTGMVTAIGSPFASGATLFDSIGAGVVGCDGLARVLGS